MHLLIPYQFMIDVKCSSRYLVKVGQNKLGRLQHCSITTLHCYEKCTTSLTFTTFLYKTNIMLIMRRAWADDKTKMSTFGDLVTIFGILMKNEFKRVQTCLVAGECFLLVLIKKLPCRPGSFCEVKTRFASLYIVLCYDSISHNIIKRWHVEE